MAGILLFVDFFDRICTLARDGISANGNETVFADDDDEAVVRFGCKLDVDLFCRFGASSCFLGRSSDDAVGADDDDESVSGSASANFPTTGSKLSEMPSLVR